MPANAQAGFQYAPPPPYFQWTNAFALVTDRFVLYDFGKLFFWTYLIVGGIVGSIVAGVSAARDSWLSALGVASAVIAFLAALTLLVMLVLFGNRFQAIYTLNPSGAFAESRSRMGRWGSWAALILGILARRPGLAGAGAIGLATSSTSIGWDEVRRVRLHPRQCVISLMNSWRVVLRLYCTPLNYDQVVATVAHYISGARIDGGLR